MFAGLRHSMHSQRLPPPRSAQYTSADQCDTRRR